MLATLNNIADGIVGIWVVLLFIFFPDYARI